MNLDPRVGEKLAKLEALAAHPGTPAEGRAARAAISRFLGIRLAVPPYVVGERVYAGQTKQPRCRDCGGAIFRIGAGVGPHAAQLTCDACGRFSKWLRREIVMPGAAP
jgi:hypothetical protein